MKNPKSVTANRNRDLPACSAVHQPNAPPSVPDTRTLRGTCYYVMTPFFRSRGKRSRYNDYGLDDLRFQSRKGQDFFHKNVQTTYRVHLLSYSVGNEFSLRGYSSRDVRLTAHLHLVPVVGMNGRTSPFPLCDFMARKQIILPLLYQHPSTPFPNHYSHQT